MPSYQSRHQPRVQTVIGGRILEPETYDRFYDLTCDALQCGTLPALTLPAGRLMVRFMSDDFGIDAARTIPPAASMKLDVRYSGRRLDGRPGQGALYLATIAGSLREFTHYALNPPPAKPTLAAAGRAPLWAPGGPDRTAAYMQGQQQGAKPPDGKRFYLFRTTRALRFADLRVTSLWRTIVALLQSGEGAARYGIAGHALPDLLAAAAGTPQDYSAARAMADAVHDRGSAQRFVGVCALSARSDRDSGLTADSHGDPTGGLVFALFGRDGECLDALTPAAPPSKPEMAIFDSFAALNAAIA